MRKNQINEVIEKNKRKRSEQLKEYISKMEKLIEERELTKKMYFWEPGKNSSLRKWNESRRRIRIEIKMAGLTVHYSRSYNESCRIVYASDTLFCDEYESFTVADAKKLIAAIEEILQRRND